MERAKTIVIRSSATAHDLCDSFVTDPVMWIRSRSGRQEQSRSRTEYTI